MLVAESYLAIKKYIFTVEYLLLSIVSLRFLPCNSFCCSSSGWRQECGHDKARIGHWRQLAFSIHVINHQFITLHFF
jgi:hypothetical protein